MDIKIVTAYIETPLYTGEYPMVGLQEDEYLEEHVVVRIEGYHYTAKWEETKWLKDDCNRKYYLVNQK